MNDLLTHALHLHFPRVPSGQRATATARVDSGLWPMHPQRAMQPHQAGSNFGTLLLRLSSNILKTRP